MDTRSKLEAAYKRFFGDRRDFGDLKDSEIEMVRRIEESGSRVSGLLSSSKALHGFWVGPQYSGGKRLNDTDTITRELLYVKPVDELDYIAMLHDLEYSLAATVEDEKKRIELYRNADEIFVKKLKYLETNWRKVFSLLFGGTFSVGLGLTQAESGNLLAAASAFSLAYQAAGELLETGATAAKAYGAGKYFENRLEKGETSYYTYLKHDPKEIDEIINRIMEVGMEEDALFLFKYKPPPTFTEERIKALPPPDTKEQQLRRILKQLELLDSI